MYYECSVCTLQAFSPGAMETFLARTIIPKLEACLDLMDINPRNQNIGMLFGVYCVLNEVDMYRLALSK